MKSLFKISIITLILSFATLQAEEIEINMTQGYANDIWYSLEEGVLKSEPKDNWDIAFQVGPVSQNAGIWINSQKGMQLWVIPGSDADTWGTAIDTNGIATWDSPVNSIESWNVGAFNTGKDGFAGDGDYGWGAYNMVNHAVVGDKVFVLKLADGKFKAVMIDGLVNKVYTFKIADLDGSNEMIKEVSRLDYVTKNFAYYSISNDIFLDREPDYDSWTMQFGKYTGLVLNNDNVLVPYPVTGIRINQRYRVARVEGINQYKSVPPELNDANYTPIITAIGDNWKVLDNQTFTFKIVENLSFFITDAANEDENPVIHKIVFKSFDGSSTGKMIFELNPEINSVEYTFNSSEMNIFPSVVESNSVINIDFTSSKLNNSMNINIIDMTGTTVLNQSISNAAGTGSYTISIPELSTGMYFVTVDNAGKFYTQKLIVK